MNTSSEAGLLGRPVSPNYAAAKAGIIALTLAHGETSMGRYGVTANTIAPRTRAAHDRDAPGLRRRRPRVRSVRAGERVAARRLPGVTSCSANVSGQVFVVYGRMIDVVQGPGVDRHFDVAALSSDEVEAALTPFYAERKPISDGYVYRGTPP